MRRTLLRHLFWLAALAIASGAAAIQLDLSLGTVEAPNFRASAVATSIGDNVFRVTAGEIVILGRTFRNVNVTCGIFRLEADRIDCQSGVLDTGNAKMPVAFSWDSKTQALLLTVVPQPKERWRLETRA